MPDFTARDLRLLKAMHISPPEEPELTRPDITVKMGQEYWDLLERTAARVNTWPSWKTGTTRKK